MNEEMMLPKHTRLISLGSSCQCAFQIRRHTGVEAASYFDWLGTPHHGLIHALRHGFKDCFLRANLSISDDGTTVKDNLTQFSYRHNFKTLQGSLHIDSHALDRDYLEQWEKLRFLAERWLETIKQERVLFVRQHASTVEQVLELYQALAAQAEARSVSLLLVTPPGHEIAIDHPNIFVEQGCLPSEDRISWRGDDSIWSDVLTKYWSSHSRLQESAAPPRSHRKAIYSSVNRARDDTKPIVLFQTSTEQAMDGLQRLAAVAIELRERAPNVRSFFLLEGADGGYLERLRLPLLMMPTHSSIYHSRAWQAWDKKETYEAVKAMALGALRASPPSLVVYDTFPSRFVLHAVAAADLPAVLCVPTLTRLPFFLQDPRIERLLQARTSLLVPYREKLMPPSLGAHPLLTFVGPITTTQPTCPVSLRNKYGLKKKRKILILAEHGSGTSDLGIVKMYLSAIECLRQRQSDIDVVLICGAQFAGLQKLGSLHEVCVATEEEDLFSCCAAADLVLAGVSYRSVFALPQVTSHIICLVTSQDAEQLAYEDCLAAARQQSNITLVEQGTLEELCSLIVERLNNQETDALAGVELGAARAADFLLKLLQRGNAGAALNVPSDMGSK